MGIFNTSINQLFGRIENNAHIILNVSPISITIEDSHGEFEGYYAFYESSALRLDVKGASIIGVAIWSSESNLNKPQYYINAKAIDIMSEVSTITKLMFNKNSESLFENTKTDIEVFLRSLGDYSENKKLTNLYQSYVPWAQVNNKEELSFDTFSQEAKEWLIKNKKGNYSNFKIEKNKNDENILIDSTEEATFQSRILNSEPYYRAILFEQAVKLIAEDDPIINSIYVCGQESAILLDKIKDILYKNKIEDHQIIIRNKNIHGASSLLEFLWDNRREKILVIKDCDSLLKEKTKVFKIMKDLLITEEKYRVVSYSRKEDKEEDNGK